MTTLPIALSYRNAVRFALAYQIPMALLFSVLLDGGHLARIAGCGMTGFWIGAAIVIFRRPQAPAPTDLQYIRLGYLGLFPIGCLCAVLLGR